MLRVRGLAKTYATPEGTMRAIDGVDFEVPEGTFYTLLGPSGCGKTTTLRCVAGLERPDAGEIVIGDTVVAAPERGVHVPAHGRDIGMVFQSYAIWPHLDVFSNVAYPLQVRRPRPSRADIRDRVMGALELVGMAHAARHGATKLSGGQQQRIALARAIVHHPSLLLLDEPLSNLDARLREQMRYELGELVGRVAITTLYVTHDQAEALAMADRVAVMSAGRIVQEGAPREIYGRPRTGFVAAFLGSANFLPGAVVETGNGAVVVDLDAGGGRLRLGASLACAPGDTVDVVVRPEDMDLLESAPADAVNVVAGTIERLTFQGGQSECDVRVGAHRVRVALHPATAPADGARAWLRINPARCVLFHGGDTPHDGAA